MTVRGLSVSVVEFLLPFSQPLIRRWAASCGPNWSSKAFRSSPGFAVERIESKGNGLSVRSVAVDTISADMVLVAVGSRPETGLARAAGIETGVKGAICVNRHMKPLSRIFTPPATALKPITVCLEKTPIFPWAPPPINRDASPVKTQPEETGNTPALRNPVRQDFRSGGRTNRAKDDEALKEGFPPVGGYGSLDHKVYYPHAEKMRIRIPAIKRPASYWRTDNRRIRHRGFQAH